MEKEADLDDGVDAIAPFRSSKKRNASDCCKSDKDGVQIEESVKEGALMQSPAASNYAWKLETAVLNFFKEVRFTVPITVSETENSGIEDPKFGLSTNLIKRLRNMGIRYLFPVQKALIPLIKSTQNCVSMRSPGDIYVFSHTGSGKTLSYAIPVVEALKSRAASNICSLIVVPTRELGAQVRDVFRSLTSGLRLKVGLVTGTSKISDLQQSFTHINNIIESKLSNVNILIATPGRLVHYISKIPDFDLSHVRYLVIDEVDCLMDQNFGSWTDIVLRALNKYPTSESQEYHRFHPNIFTSSYQKRFRLSVNHFKPIQKLLFSATIINNPASIKSLDLYNPIFIGEELCPTKSSNAFKSAFKNNLPEKIVEYMIVCVKKSHKPLSLVKIIAQNQFKKVLVFTNSTESTKRLKTLLNIFANLGIHNFFCKTDDGKNNLLSFVELSSDMRNEDRKRAIRMFKGGHSNILVCTNVLSRGIDIDNIDAVINYDVPVNAKSYVHRVGRTGRAGREGKAFTIVDRSQAKWFKEEMTKIERFPRKVHRIVNKSSQFEPVMNLYTQALKELSLVFSSS